MSTTDATPAADRGSECNALLGPTVPDSVLAYLHAYGDSRADEDGRSGLRIGEAILALRRWVAEVQAAERERWIAACNTVADDAERHRRPRVFRPRTRVPQPDRGQAAGRRATHRSPPDHADAPWYRTTARGASAQAGMGLTQRYRATGGAERRRASR